ncbi:structural maintenance of chromosomes protein 4 isoform X2 [Parasteatoda tepidariorum]|nr:structural maintenance of chromosomes protein 4 isoform X2 [Parasteatoda tepidariorum]
MDEGEVESQQKECILNPDGSITLDDVTIPPAPTPALTVDATKERLIITDLLVRDFKSYAGSHTLGPFNKNFSCIVGPNGSGKSNVIDALLFVFGYRAQRIRSKKVSVLIHKSDKFTDLTSCSVTVNFAMIKDQGDDCIVLPDSKFCVTRTGHKDNSSTYEINGRRAQYKDVANLLKSYGIDLEYNRFMILQGEIELISMMKPKGVTDQDTGMLEYIEDIIGSNRFIKPIQHFNEKMEAANEKRLEMLNNLKIIEKERADAEKPRNKALEYLELANNLTLMQNSVLQAEIKASTEAGEILSDKKNGLVQKTNELSTSLNEVEDIKNLKENDLEKIVREYENCLKTVEEHQVQFTKLEHTDAACRENLKNNKDKLKKLAKNLETEELKISKLKKQPETLKGEISELEEKKKKIEATKAVEEDKLTELMGSMKDEIQGFQEEKDSLEKELVQLKDTVNQKKSELDLAQSELDLCLSSERKEIEKLESMQTDYDKVTSLIQDEDRAIKKANERLPEVQCKLKSAKVELVEKEKNENTLNEELKHLRIKLDETTNSLSSSQNRSTLTKAFLDEKKKGRLTGVYGRLGDLGAIDPKYDIAISTACGPLDNIVTDTIDTAQDCVEYLKQNNLGYTTFIALDKMKIYEPHTKEKMSTPENVPRLFDLITVKDKNILPAFYYALGNTLVAKDLEQATRVGLQGDTRHRVVTLKGELVDVSGTMSGGGGKVLKGRMGQCIVENVSQEEVDQLNKEINSIVSKLADIKRTKKELGELVEQATKEIGTLQLSIKKSQMNYDGYIDQEKSLKHQISDQEKNIVAAAPDKKLVKKLEKEIAQHQENYAKATSTASVVENKVKSIQDQILAVTKGKYGAAQKKIDSLAKEIASITQNITKNSALLKNSDKNLKKAEEKIASLKEEIEKCDKAKESLKEELKTLETKGAEVTQKKSVAEEALREQEELKMKVSVEIKSLTKAVTQVKSEILDLKNQVKLTDIEIKTNEGRIKGFKSQLSKLELQQIEDESTELPVLTSEELDEVNVNKMNYKIGELQSRVKEMNPDLRAIEEFKKKEEMYRAKLKDLEMAVAERDHFRQHYETLRKFRMQEFMRGFNIITLKVKELYQMMTLGGDAELELVDSLDPFSEGIEYSVRPLRKSWKMIRNLSGGEKTLSSLSLVFALHYYRTTPFFVMDEIDAALDFRNVSIIGSYIKDRTKNAQFIVISLRENMFLLADHLVGIYKTNNRTKNVYLSPPTETGESDSISELTKGRKTNNVNETSKNGRATRVTFKSPEKENETRTTQGTPRNSLQKISQNTERISTPPVLHNHSTGDSLLISTPTKTPDKSNLDENRLHTSLESIENVIPLNEDDSLIIGVETEKENNLNESDSFIIAEKC